MQTKQTVNSAPEAPNGESSTLLNENQNLNPPYSGFTDDYIIIKIASYEPEVHLYRVVGTKFSHAPVCYYIQCPRQVEFQTTDPQAAWSRFVYEALQEFVSMNFNLGGVFQCTPERLSIPPAELRDETKYTNLNCPDDNIGLQIIEDMNVLASKYHSILGAHED